MKCSASSRFRSRRSHSHGQNTLRSRYRLARSRRLIDQQWSSTQFSIGPKSGNRSSEFVQRGMHVPLLPDPQCFEASSGEKRRIVRVENAAAELEMPKAGHTAKEPDRRNRERA